MAGIENTFQFQTIKLWEHLTEIENGDYPELAPLLVLCTEDPTLETIKREIAIVSASNLEELHRKDLLSMILSIASREFPREPLKTLFKKEIDMGLYDTVYDDWIRDAENRAEAKGEAKGEVNSDRKNCLRVLSRRLGALPNDLIQYVNQASSERCQDLMFQGLYVTLLSELDWRPSN